MKNKILTLIIGMLIGAIVTTLVFFVYSKTLNSNMPEMEQVNGNIGEPPERPNQNGGTPPEMPASSNNNNI